MRQTKQDRINKLERDVAHYKEELEKSRITAKRNQQWYFEQIAKQEAKLTTCKEALGRIIKIVDRAILKRRSTEDERSIKEVAKRALEESK